MLKFAVLLIAALSGVDKVEAGTSYAASASTERYYPPSAYNVWYAPFALRSCNGCHPTGTALPWCVKVPVNNLQCPSRAATASIPAPTCMSVSANQIKGKLTPSQIQCSSSSKFSSSCVPTMTTSQLNAALAQPGVVVPLLTTDQLNAALASPGVIAPAPTTEQINAALMEPGVELPAPTPEQLSSAFAAGNVSVPVKSLQCSAGTIDPSCLPPVQNMSMTVTGSQVQCSVNSTLSAACIANLPIAPSQLQCSANATINPACLPAVSGLTTVNASQVVCSANSTLSAACFPAVTIAPSQLQCSANATIDPACLPSVPISSNVNASQVQCSATETLNALCIPKVNVTDADIVSVNASKVNGLCDAVKACNTGNPLCPGGTIAPVTGTGSGTATATCAAGQSLISYTCSAVDGTSAPTAWNPTLNFAAGSIVCNSDAAATVNASAFCCTL